MLVFDRGLAVLPRIGPNLSRRAGFSKLDVGCIHKRIQPTAVRGKWMFFCIQSGPSIVEVMSSVNAPSEDSSTNRAGWTEEYSGEPIQYSPARAVRRCYSRNGRTGGGNDLRAVRHFTRNCAVSIQIDSLQQVRMEALHLQRRSDMYFR